MINWLDLDYKPKLPVNKSMGIGIVGAGEIIREAHLPAYQMAGFNVVGITNRTLSVAEQVAQRYNIPKVYATVEELIADPEVEIVDIALWPEQQPDIVQLATAAGKHVLCQKPLAANYASAQRIVDLCAVAGVKGAINHQMRWAPGIRASHTLIKRGLLGELTQATIQVNVRTDFAAWPALRTTETLEIMNHSIHYMDAIRFLFGTPEYIYADGAQYPGQSCVGETRSLIHMKFPGDTRGLIHDNHNNLADQEDWFASYRFEGTKGIIKGTNGVLYNYPVGREDTISFLSHEIDPTCWFTPQLEGRWFPHAFMGTMGELMCAIEEDREPENSVHDDLFTMQMVIAAYLSIKENRPVRLDEIK